MKKASAIVAFGQRRRTTIIVAIVALVVIAACAALRRPASKAGVQEGFYAVSTRNLPSDWKGPKNLFLVTQGLHFMFTDGSYGSSPQVLEPRVMIMPSMKDTMCFYTTSAPAEIDCRDLHPAQYADVDPSLMVSAAYRSSNPMVSRPPLAAEDAQLRVLNALYTLRKSCLVLLTPRITPDTRNRQHMLMRLPAGRLATHYFLLRQPFMVCGANTLLYTVSYMREDYSSASNSIVDYDSSSTTDVQVLLKPVDGVVRGVGYTTASGTASNIQVAAAGYKQAELEQSGATVQLMQDPGPPARMPLNLFYCTPLRSLAAEVPTSEAATVCLDLGAVENKNMIASATSSSPAQVFLSTTLRLVIMAYPSVPGAPAGSAINVRVQVSTSEPTADIKVPADAQLVLTYSMNLLSLLAYSNKGLRIKRWTAATPMRMEDPSNVPEHLKGLKASRDDVHPLTIPNLLEVVNTMVPGN